jgi:short-subunit dehydrogenase
MGHSPNHFARIAPNGTTEPFCAQPNAGARVFDPTDMSLPQPSQFSAALVTGASAGIGSCIARELAARGHNLVLVARRKALLDELATELSSTHAIKAHTFSCDLAKPAARGRLPGQIADLGLAVEILVNNAGFATNGPFHEVNPPREIEQVRVLVEAPVALCSSFIPAMVERGRGAILNVSSSAAMQPLPYSAGYSAAKAYLLTFSEAIHHELKGHGVTVTALCPGPVATKFWEISGWRVTGGQTFEQAVPRPAWITPEQAARAGVKGLDAGERVVVPHAAFRQSLRASRYIPHAVKLPILERVMRPR